MSQDEPKSIFSALRGLFRRRSADSGPAVDHASMSDDETAARQKTPAPPIEINAENRDQWLRYAREAPLAYGHWADLKRLYKQAEQTQDLDLLAILIARLDLADFPANPYAPVVNPLHPFDITTLHAMRIIDSHAYLAVRERNSQLSLLVVDVSDPALPRQIGSLSLSPGEKVTGFAIKGELAVVVTARRQDFTTHFIDISRPAKPTLIRELKTSPSIGIAFIGSHLAILFADRQSGKLSLYTADPATAGPVGFTPVSNPQTLKVDGNVVYVQSASKRITAYDITAPAAPTAARHLTIAAANDFAVQESRLALTVGYASGGQEGSGLYLYDFGRPQRHVGFLSIEHANSVDIQGDFAYVGVNLPYSQQTPIHRSGLKIVDIKDLSRPRLVGEVGGGKISAIAAHGQQIFVTMKHDEQEVGTLRSIDVSDPTRPILLGRSPDAATLGYMKRRARRLLRTLAAQAPDLYVELAARVLAEAGRGRKELDTQRQWVSMDLLYGGADRWEQTAHGRGSYQLRYGGLRLRVREERNPALWNRSLAQALALAANPDLPWQTHEAAIKMLRGMRSTLPKLTEPLTARYLRSPSPLLIVIATQGITAQIMSGQNVPADIAADAFYLGSRRARAAVQELLVRQEQNQEQNDIWSAAFAERLYSLANLSIANETLSRRVTLAFACLISRLPERLNKLTTPRLTALLYATRRPELMAWALAAMQQAAANDIDTWLIALEPLPPDLRDVGMEQLRQAVRGQRFGPSILPALALHATAWIRAAGWELIAASATDPGNIARLWRQLMEATEETDALRSAMASPAALALLDRIAFSWEKIEALLPSRPFLIGLLSPAALRSMLNVLPVQAMPALIEAASEAQWPALNAALVAALHEPQRSNAFWREAWPRLGEGDAPLLVARLLDDPALADTFLNIHDVMPLLETANPVYGPLLGRWLRANGEDRYGRDTPELLRIATHMLPDIRAYGLERARALGMGLPFALRLLESELPPAVAVGREFIDRTPHGDAVESDVILALCDSPKPSVRAYGREILEARWKDLPQDLLLNRLAENPDPATQAYLAGKMLGGADRFEQAATFDRQVLRGRDRACRAKELVKQRLDREPSHDIPLLLEMARSRTPRDAEWALGQLALLALDGVEIEGFTVKK